MISRFEHLLSNFNLRRYKEGAGADLPMWRIEGFQTLLGILVHSFADGAAVVGRCRLCLSNPR
jgi:zinc transporter ZupT